MIDKEEYDKMIRVPSIGPKMIEYLELIGIEKLSDLRDLSSQELRFRINEALGRDHINETGRRALENLIEASLLECQ